MLPVFIWEAPLINYYYFASSINYYYISNFEVNNATLAICREVQFKSEREFAAAYISIAKFCSHQVERNNIVGKVLLLKVWLIMHLNQNSTDMRRATRIMPALYVGHFVLK